MLSLLSIKKGSELVIWNPKKSESCVDHLAGLGLILEIRLPRVSLRFRTLSLKCTLVCYSSDVRKQLKRIMEFLREGSTSS